MVRFSREYYANSPHISGPTPLEVLLIPVCRYALLGMSTTMTEVAQPLSNKISNDVQPDIHYHPDYSKYVERTTRRLTENPDLPNEPLPTGFPDQVEGPIVWRGDEWTNEEQWVYKLSDAELQEIDNAVQYFKGRDYDSCLITVSFL